MRIVRGACGKQNDVCALGGQIHLARGLTQDALAAITKRCRSKTTRCHEGNLARAFTWQRAYPHKWVVRAAAVMKDLRKELLRLDGLHDGTPVFSARQKR